MAKKEDNNFSSLKFLWAIIDTFVNILVLTTVTILLSSRLHGWFLVFMIIVFIAWAFRPMYTAFKEFFKNFQKKKLKRKLSKKTAQFLYFLIYLSIFFLSLWVFVISVNFLGQLLHPGELTFSLILSSTSIILYHHFTKKEFCGPMWSFSKFFFIATIFLFVSVLLFGGFGLQMGINLEPQTVTFDVYIVNNAVTQDNIYSAWDYSSSLWKKYNVSLNYKSINEIQVNLTSEEVNFLFDNGSVQEECVNYSKIINKITNKTEIPFLIFLGNNNGKHAGRGSLCNYTFALVSPEKMWFLDFTGWDTAHEIGHALGLADSVYYERVRKNLMNDEIKKLLFFNSDYLNQHQIDIVVNKIKNLNGNSI